MSVYVDGFPGTPSGVIASPISSITLQQTACPQAAVHGLTFWQELFHSTICFDVLLSAMLTSYLDQFQNDESWYILAKLIKIRATFSGINSLYIECLDEIVGK